MAGDANLVDEYENRVAVTINEHLLDPLTVPGRFALYPPSGSAAGVKRGPPGAQRFFQRGRIHPGEHQDLSGIPLLHHGGNQAVGIESNSIHAHIVPVRDTNAMQRIVAELRRSLAEELLEAGPDAATLCAGWTVRDLAAHLVVREHRPDAALGIAVPALARWTARVQTAEAAEPFPEVVEAFAAGPPLLSPFRIPLVARLADPAEFAIHREDVRRARPGWQPLPVDPALFDVLWQRLRAIGSITARRSPVGIRVVRTDAPGNLQLNRRSPQIILRGDPLEILLRMSGRDEVDVEVIGDEAAVRVFNSARRHL
jgi:uncharacterized protein (TIGR03085 family)